MTEYNFRQLNSTDIFPICNIISKIGIRELKDCFKGQDLSEMTDKKNESAMMAIGASVTFDVAGVIFANMQKCQKEIYTFLSSVTELSQEELKAISPADFADIVINFFKKDELKDFIKVVSKFIK